MDQDLAADVTDNILTCPICLEIFNDPRVLPCYHTFCLTCVTDYARAAGNSASFQCPLCRETIHIPVGGLKSLKRNFVFEKVKTILDQRKSRQRDTSGSDRVLLPGGEPSQDRPQGTSDVPVVHKCPEHHDNELRYYCQDDDNFVCADCIVTRHRRHNCMPIKEIAGKTKGQIQKLLEKALLKLPNIQQIEDDYSTFLLRHTQQEQNLLSDIDRHAAHVCSIIMELRDKLKNRARTAFEMERLASESYKSELDLQRASLESTCEFAQQLITNGSESDIITHSKMLKDKLSQLNQVQLSRFNGKEKINFAPGDKTEDSIMALLGEVKVHGSQSSKPRTRENGIMSSAQSFPQSSKDYHYSTSRLSHHGNRATDGIFTAPAVLLRTNSKHDQVPGFNSTQRNVQPTPQKPHVGRNKSRAQNTYGHLADLVSSTL